MFEFFQKSKTKVGSEESAAPVTPGLVVAQARMRPLCFLDFDDKGLFLRFVHVSSSVYADRISTQGLKPLQDARGSLLSYLKATFPQADAYVLLGLIENDPDGYRSNLVKMRLSAQKNGQATLSLLPLGAYGYLRSAADNAVRDGGEVYRIARCAINSMHGTEAPEPYPDATAVVFIVRHYLVGNGPNLELAGIGPDSHGVDLKLAVSTNFESEYWCTYGINTELIMTSPYPASAIDCVLSLEQYLAHPTEKISRAAVDEVAAIRKKLGF